MHVTIVGAGLVGLSTAFFLHHAGYRVSIIEKCPDSAQETSFANGGQLSAFYCHPFASPKLYAELEHTTTTHLNPRYALASHYLPDQATAQWLALVQRLSNHKTVYQESAHDLFRLARCNFQALSEVLKLLKTPLPSHHQGILSLYRTKTSFIEGEIFAQLLSQWGLVYQQHSPKECAERVQTDFNRKGVYAGLYIPEDHSANAYEYTQTLTRYLETQKVRFYWNTTVRSLITEKNSVIQLLCDGPEGKQVLKIDQLVLCTAASSNQLLPQLSQFLHGIGGYSISIDDSNSVKPALSLIDQDQKIVLTPFTHYMRVAGLSDLNRMSTSDIWLRYQKQCTLLNSLRHWFPSYRHELKMSALWHAYRPLIVDSVPMIGQMDYQNLYINIGHGFWGWTTCCATAYLLKQVMSRQAQHHYSYSSDPQCLNTLKKQWKPWLSAFFEDPTKALP